MLIDGGGPLLRQCFFINDPQPALLVRNGAAPTLMECTFQDAEMVSLESDPVLTGCTFEGDSLWGRSRSNLSLTDCLFESARMELQDSSATMSGCTVRNNKRFAIELWDSNSVLTDCLFERNGGDVPGGVIRSYHGGGLTLVNCRFLENNGPGVWSSSGGTISLTQCSFLRNTTHGVPGVSVTAEKLLLRDCAFVGNSSQWDGSAIHFTGDLLKATGCLFAGNRNSHRLHAGALFSNATLLLVSNCTFVGNWGWPNTIERWSGPQAELTHCIIWDGPDPFTQYRSFPPEISVTYSDIQGGYAGEGNIDVDPCFVEPGYWADPNDPNVVLGPENPRAVWVNGDYHLKSQGGHWDRASQTWVRDSVTSPCIDAGDPDASLGKEPFPNGAVVNLGACGGTAEASKSYFGEPVCESQIPGDLNGDCRVDATDTHILTVHQPLQIAAALNAPPVILLTGPQEGESFAYPAPIPFRVEAADSDGSIICVNYVMEYDLGGTQDRTTIKLTDPSNGWRCDWSWWLGTGAILERSYVVWAEAMDDDGNVAISQKVKVTVRMTD